MTLPNTDLAILPVPVSPVTVFRTFMFGAPFAQLGQVFLHVLKQLHLPREADAGSCRSSHSGLLVSVDVRTLPDMPNSVCITRSGTTTADVGTGVHVSPCCSGEWDECPRRGFHSTGTSMKLNSFLGSEALIP